jgi:hypothetical protein
MEERKSFFDSVRIGYIKSFIVVSFLCYLSAEILSIFNGFSLFYLTIFWGVINIVCFIKFYKSSISYKLESKNFYTSLEPHIKWYLGIILIVIIIPLLFQALYIPPNNWDSMTYHMSRVEHWRQNENVYPFPTGNIRQVILSPLAEYVIANLQILSQADYFANLVQFLAWIGVFFGLTLLVKRLGYLRHHQFVIGILFLSIPMALFQSTTTQNDLIAAFFLISFLYFGFELIQSNYNLRSSIFFILAIALGGFTKYTTFLFALPFGVYLLFKFSYKFKTIKILSLFFLSILFFCIIFGPFLIRNYLNYGFILGDKETSDSVQNSSFNFLLLASNFIKIIFDHLTLPIESYMQLLTKCVDGLHELIGISKDKIGSNFYNIPYKIDFILNEDSTGSLIHIVLWLFTSLFLLVRIKSNRLMVKFMGPTWVGFLLYAILFKWQPWHARLMLPWMLLTVVPIGIVLSNFLIGKTFKSHIFTVSLIFYGLIPVYFNLSKPLMDPLGLYRQFKKMPKGTITADIEQTIPLKYRSKILSFYKPGELGLVLKSGISIDQKEKLYFLQDSIHLFENERKNIFNTSRMELYYVANKFLYQKHLNIVNSINGKIPQIKLDIYGDSYEYPIWIFLRKKFGSNFQLERQSNINGLYSNNNFTKESDIDYVITDKGSNIRLINNKANKLILSL